MPFVSNPGFLAVAFIEGSAAFIILVLYSLLAPSFSARFFRFWIAGWTIYTALEGFRIYSFWRHGSGESHLISALSIVASVLFFGGWSGPVFGPPILRALLPLFWFVLRVFIFIFIYIWVRGTLPRFRYDQLMEFGWKGLVPVGLMNLMATALVVVLLGAKY